MKTSKEFLANKNNKGDFVLSNIETQYKYIEIETMAYKCKNKYLD